MTRRYILKGLEYLVGLFRQGDVCMSDILALSLANQHFSGSTFGGSPLLAAAQITV